MNKEKRTEIFKRFQQANPEPKTELEYSTPFELLAAVLLSAQATDKGVNIATRKLFAVANTPAAIAALGVAGVENTSKQLVCFGRRQNTLCNPRKFCEINTTVKYQQTGKHLKASRALAAKPPTWC